MTAAALAVAEQAIAAEQLPAGVTATALTRTGAPATALLEVAEGATMLVVGTNGHGQVSRLLFGSVAMACAHRSEGTPIVITPAVTGATSGA